MHHLLAGENLALITNRQVATSVFQHALGTDMPVDLHILETAHASAYILSLSLYAFGACSERTPDQSCGGFLGEAWGGVRFLSYARGGLGVYLCGFVQPDLSAEVCRGPKGEFSTGALHGGYGAFSADGGAGTGADSASSPLKPQAALTRR